MNLKEKIIKSEEWGRFIEHRPYFRQMPKEDWEALKLFVEELFAEERKKWVGEIEKLSEKSGFGKDSYDDFIRISQIDWYNLKSRIKNQ